MELDTPEKLNRARLRPRPGERGRLKEWPSNEPRRPSHAGEECCGGCHLKLAGGETGEREWEVPTSGENMIRMVDKI